MRTRGVGRGARGGKMGEPVNITVEFNPATGEHKYVAEKVKSKEKREEREDEKGETDQVNNDEDWEENEKQEKRERKVEERVDKENKD